LETTGLLVLLYFIAIRSIANTDFSIARPPTQHNKHMKEEEEEDIDNLQFTTYGSEI